MDLQQSSYTGEDILADSSVSSSKVGVSSRLDEGSENGSERLGGVVSEEGGGANEDREAEPVEAREVWSVCMWCS